MRALRRLQRSLESIHAVDAGVCVTQFLVDEHAREALPGARDGIPEQLFIHEDDDAVDVALYVDREVIEHVEADPPSRRLHSGNFESFCIALEGVSHFVLLAWRTRHDRPISGLELEIQAEVDKFVVSWLLLAEQGVALRSSAGLLRRRLFEQCSVRAEVANEEVERYEHASRYADTFCQGLVDATGPREVRARVRAYYRMGLADKVRRVA